MQRISRLSLALLAVAATAPAALADGRAPGSVLVYPIHRSNLAAPGAFFTVLSVTNSNVQPTTGATNVMFEYVNTVVNPLDTQLPLDCFIVDRVEALTPADTLSVLTSCHNASGGQEGYVVVTAQDPTKFKTAWSFDYLLGSELVVTSLGGVFGVNALPYTSPVADRQATDLDGNGRLDFDDAEYEALPERLYIPSFVAVAGTSLVLINMSGNLNHVATVKFDAFNDNEFPLSATKTFRCWFEERLQDVSLIFREDFLKNNTPDDPQELDIDCDNDDDFETGWAMIDGIVANSQQGTIVDPAILGAITVGGEPVQMDWGPMAPIDGAELLWESHEKQLNGEFFSIDGLAPPFGF